MLLILPLFSRLNEIQGWFEFEEADLLVNALIKTCTEISSPHNIVEVGSYHGKSTVLLGTVVKHLFPDSKVYAIDPHEGTIGAVGQDLQSVIPSLHMFKENMKKFELTEVVELIKECSFNVAWDQPISFLFIDGLHDYFNVARDFKHFSKFLRHGGYIAFHDYAAYYPGVIAFVNELIQSGSYRKECQVKSLIVLQSVR